MGMGRGGRHGWEWEEGGEGGIHDVQRMKTSRRRKQRGMYNKVRDSSPLLVRGFHGGLPDSNLLEQVISQLL